MKCKNGRQQPVAFISKFLNKTERNYKIHDKKMLVVIRGLENQRHLLEDKLIGHFTCLNLTLKYVPETKIRKTDRLSKKLD